MTYSHNTNEIQYLDALRQILEEGVTKGDRTGTGTLSLFGMQMRFDLSQGFPLFTSKRVHFPSVVHELLWFLSGSTNVKDLQKNKVKIWNEWATEEGDLGPIYGKQWRDWNGIDQISSLIEQIRNNPTSRRLILTAMNIADFPVEGVSPQDNVRNGKMALAPCHAFCMFEVRNNKLNCLLFCRSQDMFLGTPFNIASYALLTHLFAAQCGLSVGELIWSGGDCHIYSNHQKQVELLLTRDIYPLPTISLREKPSIFEYVFEDIALHGYTYYPAIPAPVAV